MDKPIDMILYCPKCGLQHIDSEDRCEGCPGGDCTCVVMAERWVNRPHRSHLCANPECGTIWRPADIPTNGVAAIETASSDDTWPPKNDPTAPAAPAARGWLEAAIAWNICRSIHAKWAKNRDSFFRVRQSDFIKHHLTATHRGQAANAGETPCTCRIGECESQPNRYCRIKTEISINGHQ